MMNEAKKTPAKKAPKAEKPVSEMVTLSEVAKELKLEPKPHASSCAMPERQSSIQESWL